MNIPTKPLKQTMLFLGVFCIAMGILEAIVVVYLREIYYPDGFDFPLTLLSSKMIWIEWIREMATIIMLAMIGIIAGKGNLQRFFYFLYSFAIWDIFYYVGLKLFLNWPSSFFTWDILFLIPIPWISPVLAPVICSLTMIVFAVRMLYLMEKGYALKIKYYDWGLLVLGSLIIFYSFIKDYLFLILQNGSLSKFLKLSDNVPFLKIISQYKPVDYNWFLFISGEIILLFVIIRLNIKIKRTE